MSYVDRSPQPDALRRHRGPSHAGRSLGWAAMELERITRALDGRKFLMLDDIAEVNRRISEAQAEIAKASACEIAEVRA